jgi:hypothetical protein
MPSYLVLQAHLVDGQHREKGDVHEFDAEIGRRLILMGRVSNTAPEDSSTKVDFDSMKKAELLDYAESAGFDIDESMTKAQIIAEITGKQLGGLNTSNSSSVVK